MAIFFTADTHFSHGNIIKYCNRPFASAQEMNETIYANWTALVQPRDKVYPWATWPSAVRRGWPGRSSASRSCPA